MLQNKNIVKLSREQQKAIAEKIELTNEDYELIYINYSKQILSFVTSRVKSKEDAEDLTSLIFERVLHKLKDFQWQDVTISSWIFKIARNAIIDYYRKYSERRNDSSVEQIGDFLRSQEEKIDTLVINDEEEVSLYNSIRELSESDQFLIYYKFFEELSNKEIAKLTGMSETNVGTRLHRLRTKLKKLINK